MPWVPERFSAPALEEVQRKRRKSELLSVPFFDGLLAGEFDALVTSFAGEPEVHDPVRGRIRGERAFKLLVDEMLDWLRERNVSVEDARHVITKQRGFEETVLHLDGETGRVGLPVAIVADHQSGQQLEELRLYFSSWPLGRHENRPPLLQADPELHPSDVVGEYQRALAAGDVDAIVATFEADGYAREPAGGEHVHRGLDGLRAFYEELFSNGGGIPLEHCSLMDNGASAVLEYNVVRWGRTELMPQAGVAVYERGESGKLAAARIYDDVDPPLGAAS
jgi:hypothetical protein